MGSSGINEKEVAKDKDVNGKDVKDVKDGGKDGVKDVAKEKDKKEKKDKEKDREKDKDKKDKKEKKEKGTVRDHRQLFKEGQRFLSPPMADATRAFYSSMLEENPDSKIAIKWCIEFGVLSVEQHKKVYKKFAKLRDAGAYNVGVQIKRALEKSERKKEKKDKKDKKEKGEKDKEKKQKKEENGGKTPEVPAPQVEKTA